MLYNHLLEQVLILASVHDTFEKPKSSRLLWISVPDLATAHKLKREVCLSGGARGLPNSVGCVHKALASASASVKLCISLLVFSVSTWTRIPSAQSTRAGASCVG